MKQAGIAFFDFDNTLIHGDVGPLFGRHLFELRRRTIKQRHSGVPKAWLLSRHWARIASFLMGMSVQAALYKVGAIRRSTITRAAYKGLRGVPVEAFEAEMDAFVDETIPRRAYPEMVAVLREHVAAGRSCVIITTGMEALVQRCLRHFPSSIELIGCRLRAHEGRLTGRVDGPLYGADKANILLAYCKAADVDPAHCYAYSDHYSDKHMLEAVGHGVCVNPRGRFAALATEAGWQVLRPALPED